MTLHEASAQELQEEWKRAEAYWDNMSNKLDMPWVRHRFVLAVFKTTLRQRGWRVHVLLGGPL